MSIIRKARIAYNGPALTNGEMDVRQLAPALLAFADLVDSANKAIGGEQKIKVLLDEDSINKGSFDITMLLDCGILEQAKLLVNAGNDNGIAALMQVLGWGVLVGGIACKVGRGIFTLVKEARGKTPADIQHKENNKAIISFKDGTSVTTDENTLKVFLDVNCRMSIEKIVQPVGEVEGINSFELRNPDKQADKKPIEIIKKHEVEYFRAPQAEEIDEDEPKVLKEQELTVKISSVNFEKGNKWRLTDGNNTFWASIQDEEFLQEVDAGRLSFTSGDMLVIRYYIQQIIKKNILSSEYVVTKVVEVKKRPEQIKLDFKYDKK